MTPQVPLIIFNWLCVTSFSQSSCAHESLQPHADTPGRSAGSVRLGAKSGAGWVSKRERERDGERERGDRCRYTDMYVRTCVRKCACAGAPAHACARACVRSCIYVCECVRVYAFMYACVRTVAHALNYVHMCACVCVWMDGCMD